MKTRSRDIHAHLFAAALYALAGEPIRLFDELCAAIQLIEPNPWWTGGVGEGAWS